ncbi:SpoIIAA family protein [Histidinibacterium aquaticum]|nr:STAS/SEC14 domain-containing protein [Histidinibacterium aquaticum]
MFQSNAVTEIETGLTATYGFRIVRRVTREDMTEMSDYMIDRFARHDEVDMLLVFDTPETSEPGASLSREAIEARFKSLRHVRNYVVAGAPDAAESMIETMGKLLPVNAKTFDTEAEALDWLRAQPSLS